MSYIEVKYKIFDWACNDKTPYYGTFATFEDAWGRLYEEFDSLPEDEFNDTMSEFFVVAIATEIHDPFDVRNTP